MSSTAGSAQPNAAPIPAAFPPVIDCPSDEELEKMLCNLIPLRVPNLSNSVRYNRPTAKHLERIVGVHALNFAFDIRKDSWNKGNGGEFACARCRELANTNPTDRYYDDGTIPDDVVSVKTPIWRCLYNKQADGTYNLTSRHLVHCHPMVASPLLVDGKRKVDAANKITETEREMLEKLLTTRRLNKSIDLKTTLEEIYRSEYDKETWKHFLATARQATNVPEGKEMQQLLSILQQRHLIHGDYFNFDMDENCTTSRVFAMSHKQIWNTQRNGQVIAFDTTQKTNRFGYSLCLVCGVDEYGHTMLLAVALTAHQDTDTFRWILNQIRQAVGESSFMAIRSVTTDGDAAMSKAIDETLPHCTKLRCMFHLRLNIQAQCAKLVDDVTERDRIMREWYLISSRDFIKAKYLAAKEAFNKSLPEKLASYFNKQIWSIEKKFVLCLTKDVTTFGLRSTSRVEGMNGKAKGYLGIGSKTPVARVVELLLNCVSDEDQKKVDDERKMARQLKGNGHNIATWWWPAYESCSLVAVAHLKKEAELDENYQVSGPDTSGCYSVSPSIVNQQKYEKLKQELLQDEVDALVTAASSLTLDVSADHEGGIIDDITKTAIETTRSNLDKQRAILAMITHEEVCKVSNLRTGHVTCTCGSTSRFMLPCRHVIAVNRVAVGFRYVALQIADRWKRDYMLDVNTKQPVKPQLHLWQPSDFVNDDTHRDAAEWSMNDATVDLEDKVDTFLGRVRGIAISSMNTFTQLTALVNPWIKRTLSNDPALAISQVRDPAVFYKGNVSEVRIVNRGDTVQANVRARAPTSADLALMDAQNKRARTSGVDINPTTSPPVNNR